MTLNFDLPPAMEQTLRLRAAEHGEDVESFACRMLMDQLVEEEQAIAFVPARSPEDFMARLREVIDMHPTVTTFVDDSRESIYAGRGE